MIATFNALLKNEQGLTSKQLAKALGITTAQFAGVMGAFGRRLSHTKKWPDSFSLVEDIPDHYKLTPLARRVLLSPRVDLKK
jgi:hypothetical protein